MDEDLIGKTIKNRYRVEKFLGRGGMAEVYKVFDTHRSVFLAMKVLYPDLAEDPAFVRRFKREARNLAKLQHPNIVRFYEMEQDDLLVFLTMDYIEGTTLRSEIMRAKGAPLSNERILEVMNAVCGALYYAHRSGMVHCDVKPANIMIEKTGRILLADFGIARQAEGSTTTTMATAGTPAYMAPEQVRGEDPTPQTDIYALGVLLYEMLTGGERPFTGDQAAITGTTGEKVRWEQVNVKPVSPRRHNPRVSEELETVVLKCLKKDPRRRFSSVQDLYQSLQDVFTHTGSSFDGDPEPVPAPDGADERNPQNENDAAQVITQGTHKRPSKKFWILFGFGMGIVLLFGMGMVIGQKLITDIMIFGGTNTIEPTNSPTFTETMIPTRTYTNTPAPSPTLTNIPIITYIPTQKPEPIQVPLTPTPDREEPFIFIDSTTQNINSWIYMNLCNWPRQDTIATITLIRPDGVQNGTLPVQMNALWGCGDKMRPAWRFKMKPDPAAGELPGKWTVIFVGNITKTKLSIDIDVVQ